MIKKKEKKRGTAKKAAKRKAAQKKHLDPAQVREEIAGMVKSGAKDITEAVMDHAMHGELAPAKYLFEMAKIYPAVNDGEQATVEEDCLAKTLLARLDAVKKPAAPSEEEEEEAVKANPEGDEPEEKPGTADPGTSAGESKGPVLN